MTAGCASLREWMSRLPVRHVGEAGSVTGRAGREILVHSGVDGRDVTAYRDAVRAVAGEDLPVDLAADRLCTDLIVLGISWPDMSVRAGVGWLLAARADTRRVSHIHGRTVPWNEVEEFVAPWEGFGLVEDGWLFAAAGLDREEARDMVVAGLVDEDALAALAALRGVPLPVC